MDATNSLSVILPKTGAPAEVLQLTETVIPQPTKGEILVEMLYAPINPADLNFIQGVYGMKAEPPCTPGGEGVGRVISIGTEVEEVQVGDIIIPLGWFGTWRRHLCFPADSIFIIPPGADLPQASQLKVNPMTAWRMLRDFGGLGEGDWVALNAANSGVGIALLQIAKALGIRTAAIARSASAREICENAGADLVVDDSRAGLVKLKRTIPEKELPRVAFNAVGGDSATRLMSLLAPNGELITYGAMGKEPVRVPNGLLIFKDITLRGFWVSRWMSETDPQIVQSEYRELIDTVPDLRLPIAETFPLTEISKAVTTAAEGGRSGKILLQISDTPA